MKRVLAVSIVMAISLFVLGDATESRASGCGLVPLKPLPPLGCRDLVPVCVCDEDGQNCHWTWQCVR